MQHVVHARDGSRCGRQVGKVAFEKLHRREVFEVAALAGNQAVGDADGMAATDELFRQVRSDESRAAGDQVRSHSVDYILMCARDMPAHARGEPAEP